jgi:hypothetical protein
LGLDFYLFRFHLAESRDHKSTRVLSTTTDEKDQNQHQSQRENPIREVTDGLVQGNDHKSDTATERKEIGEDAIDAGDKADPLSDNSSQNMVFVLYIFLSNFLFLLVQLSICYLLLLLICVAQFFVKI